MADNGKSDAERYLEEQFEKVSRKLDFIIEFMRADKEKSDQEHLEWEKKKIIKAAEIAALDQKLGRLEGRA